MSLGSNVRNARKAAGLEQTELADRLDWDRHKLSRRELDQVQISDAELSHIAEALNTTVSALRSGSTNQKATESQAPAPKKAPSRDEVAAKANNLVRQTVNMMSEKQLTAAHDYLASMGG